MLRDEFSTALKGAMKGKDKRATSTIRLIMAAVKDRDIAARGNGNPDGIADDEVMRVLQTMIKQRQESIVMFEKGSRQELADQEADEIDIIRGFLPEQMTDQAIADAVAALVAETNAATLKDMGPTMAALRERFAGRMDFGKASGVLKQHLSGK
jgi:uncharacterized protein YqeY